MQKKLCIKSFWRQNHIKTLLFRHLQHEYIDNLNLKILKTQLDSELYTHSEHIFKFKLNQKLWY
jgi:hypothetical protein